MALLFSALLNIPQETGFRVSHGHEIKREYQTHLALVALESDDVRSAFALAGHYVAGFAFGSRLIARTS